MKLSGSAQLRAPDEFTSKWSQEMNRVLQRLVVLAVCTVAFAGISLQANTSLAQTGWEYVPELGGYLDWDTGLVWGEHSRTISNSSWTWDGAQNIYLPQYRQLTGIADWRLPTVAEAQSAIAHGVDDVILIPGTATSIWTSDTPKKKGYAYMININTGTTFLTPKLSGFSVVPVYRAF
jgi:hypothetical protein